MYRSEYSFCQNFCSFVFYLQPAFLAFALHACPTPTPPLFLCPEKTAVKHFHFWFFNSSSSLLLSQNLEMPHPPLPGMISPPKPAPSRSHVAVLLVHFDQIRDVYTRSTALIQPSFSGWLVTCAYLPHTTLPEFVTRPRSLTLTSITEPFVITPRVVYSGLWGFFLTAVMLFGGVNSWIRAVNKDSHDYFLASASYTVGIFTQVDDR